MKSLRVIFLISLMICAIAGVARTAADFFVSMPQEHAVVFSQTQRMDMLDYFRYGSDEGTENLFGDKSRIAAETPSLLTVDVTENSTMQVAMFASKNDTVLAVISTVDIQARDAQIEFYDRNWKPLRRNPVNKPLFCDWITKDGEAHIADITMALEFIPVTINYDPEASTLTFHNNMENLVSAYDAQRLSQWLLSDIVYDVKGTKFSRRK